MQTKSPIAAAPPRWIPDAPDRSWTHIVIHHAALDKGSAASFHRLHLRRGFDELGYHFVIGNGTETANGRIEVGPRWPRQKHGAHCRIPGDRTNWVNERGIGICLVGNFQNYAPRDSQMASLVRLTAFMCRRYRVPLANVRKHSDFKVTSCPGARFPWDDFKQRVKNRLSSPVQVRLLASP